MKNSQIKRLQNIFYLFQNQNSGARKDLVLSNLSSNKVQVEVQVSFVNHDLKQEWLEWKLHTILSQPKNGRQGGLKADLTERAQKDRTAIVNMWTV